MQALSFTSVSMEIMARVGLRELFELIVADSFPGFRKHAVGNPGCYTCHGQSPQKRFIRLVTVIYHAGDNRTQNQFVYPSRSPLQNGILVWHETEWLADSFVRGNCTAGWIEPDDHESVIWVGPWWPVRAP